MDVNVLLVDAGQFGVHLIGLIILLDVDPHLRRLADGTGADIHRAHEKAAYRVLEWIATDEIAHGLLVFQYSMCLCST